MTATIAIVALILGAIAGYLLAERRWRGAAANLQTAAALAEQRQGDLSQQLSAEKTQTQALREQLSAAQSEVAAARAQFDAAQAALRETFASVSSEALERNSETFLQLARERFATISAEASGSLDQRKQQIEAMLQPMRQLLEQYQVRVAEIEKSRVESYSMLREQLGTLAETQRTLNTQTSQLVTALSRPAVPGQWGEISLRRLVELAGLSQKCDFVEQESVDTEQGRLRPDMVVKLPGGRDVVIDCKTSLDAFLEAASCADEDARRTHLLRHSQQVRSRARELWAKSYWSQFSHSPEFVVMFLPGEAFLYAAVEYDGSLIEDCLKNRVIVATPTTLIALLKAIEFGWRQEAISENAERIRDLGKDLYDRIGVVLGHLAKLGASLATTVSNYNSAVASLETRVAVTARKMGELGAKTDKEIPEPAPVDILPREARPALFSPESAG